MLSIPEWGFPCGSAGKQSTCNARDLGLIPGWEDPLEKGKAIHSSILAWRIQIHRWHHTYGRKQWRTEEPLDERGEWKSWLKLNIQKTKIMASGPITSWQIGGETTKIVTDFIFLGSKITADDDFSHEIKRRLVLRRKAMTNLDSILKSRDITLPTKVHLGKAMVFLVVMYGCESWTIKKAEWWRIDAFELWLWRRPLRVPWTERRSN